MNYLHHDRISIYPMKDEHICAGASMDVLYILRIHKNPDVRPCSLYSIQDDLDTNMCV